MARLPGNDDRNAILGSTTVAAIRLWLEVADLGRGEGRLFVSLTRNSKLRGKPLSGNAVNEIAKRAFGRGWSAHGLRARAITDTFRRSGGNALFAQAFARHAQGSTTQTYIDIEKAKEAALYAPAYE
jgi:integrase